MVNRRRLRAFLALFNVEGDVGPASQLTKRETLQRVFVKVTPRRRLPSAPFSS